ncbi:hypothetical protein VKT23_001209 [Stygiomarasmius scandens]
MLSSIFGFTTHRLKLRKYEVSEWSSRRIINNFLRSIFIHSPPSLHTTHSFYDETSTLKGKFRSKRPASRSRTVRSTVHYGKTTYLNDSSRASQGVSVSPSQSPDPFMDQHHRRTPSVTSGGLSNAPSNPFTTASRNSSSSAIHPIFLHSYSDPTPLRISREGHIQLPNALVMSGIEHAGTLVQKAFSTVLSERTIILEDDKTSLDTGTSFTKNYRHSRSIYEDKETIQNDEGGIWTLPDDFIAVYVCPIDEWERPSIHKPLLDKFSMSVTITLNSTIRSQLTSISRPLSFRGSPILSPVPLLPGHVPSSSAQSFAQTIPTRQMSPGMLSTTSNKSANTSPLIPSELMRHLRKTYSQVHFSPVLNLYLSDLFSASRHHPQLDGMLLSATAMSEAIELTRASRVLGSSPTGMELIIDKAHEISKRNIGFDSGSDIDSSNREVWIDVVDYGDVGNGHAVAGNGVATQLSASSAAEDSNPKEVAIRVLDVTQADVARIFPRVVTHRVRVRNGSEDEVLSSALFGATNAPHIYDADETRSRRIQENHVTVKDIMVNVLHTVN